MTKREMLINYVPGEECRIAIVEDGRLEEFYQERASAESHVGNIYKGRVVSVEPSIQAAFVDFGLDRNGFLHISDLHPKYFPGEAREESERVGQKTPRRERPPIQRCLRRGQNILVQVLKEGIGTKGPTLTSYLSIPGRFIVMLPDMERLGVSRKIEDDEVRHQIRQILDELNPPKGFGFIVRTAGIGRNKTDLKRDLAYLLRLWKAISRRMETTPGVGELYTESDLVIRTIRDVFSTHIERIIIDDETAARRARNFLAIASPRSGTKVFVYRDPVPLFHRYGIERQIENINQRKVPLPSGGSLVIDTTEALVAIDVNSGSTRDTSDPEATAYKTNMEAVDEICRQLRLRDLGGVIVNDLIDMRKPQHRRAIEQRLRNHLKMDRARTRVLPISQFGIVEMTRQRMRPSLKSSVYVDCPGCQGLGHVKSAESVVLDVMRRLALAMHRPEVTRIELTVSPDVAFHLLNRRRANLVKLEQQMGRSVLVRVGGTTIDYVQLDAYDARGVAVDFESLRQLKEPAMVELHLAEAETDLEELGVPLTEEDLPEADTTGEPPAEPPEPPEQEPPVSAGATRPAEERPGSEQVLPAAEGQEEAKPRRRRRRRRGGRVRGDGITPTTVEQAAEVEAARVPAGIGAPGQPADQHAVQAGSDTEAEAETGREPSVSAAQPAGPSQAVPAGNGSTGRRRRRRRRGGRGGTPQAASNVASAAEAGTTRGSSSSRGVPGAPRVPGVPGAPQRSVAPGSAPQPRTAHPHPQQASVSSDGQAGSAPPRRRRRRSRRRSGAQPVAGGDAPQGQDSPPGPTAAGNGFEEPSASV
jgi:ribonuclease E